MSGTLAHSPADVVRHLLVDLGGGVLGGGAVPWTGGAWPIYVSSEPDDPDSVITIFDTAGITQGRIFQGEIQEHQGFQVRVRDANHVDGYTKANALAVLLDESSDRVNVTFASTNYFVHAITRTTGVLVLGKNVPIDKRNVFTINAIVALRQV